jgi:hypothetical protein
MTNYAVCCCRSEAVGWIIAASSTCSIASLRTDVTNDGRVSTRSIDANQTLRVRLEKTTSLLALTDVGSSCGGQVDVVTPFSFDRRTILDFIDLNQDSGQTWSNGDPIYRVPATLGQINALSSFQWPTNDPVYDYGCLGLIDPTIISYKNPQTLRRTEVPTFNNNPYATFEVYRETDIFGQPPTSTTQFRYSPIASSAGNQIEVLTLLALPSDVPFLPMLGIRRYRDEGSFGQFVLDDLGIDDGVRFLPLGFDPTDTVRFPTFDLSIDGVTIDRQSLLDFGDDVRCLFRTGTSINLSYRDVNQQNGGAAFETEYSDYELSGSHDQEIISAEYVFA